MSSSVTLEAAGMSRQQRGCLSPSHTNSALSSEGPRGFTPELCLCKSLVVGLVPAILQCRGQNTN